jgi:hypothetical protein
MILLPYRGRGLPFGPHWAVVAGIILAALLALILSG